MDLEIVVDEETAKQIAHLFEVTLRPHYSLMCRRYIDILGEDIKGIYYLELTRLVVKYDRTRGIPFRPYLVNNLNAFMFTKARSISRRRKRELLFEEGLDDLRSDEPDMIRFILQPERKFVLHEAVNSLPMSRRRAVNLVYLDNPNSQDAQQIATQHGIVPATLRSNLRNGVNQLRERLEQQADLF